MNSTLIAVALTSAVVVAIAFIVRHYLLSARRSADFDGGVVSQSWLIEHRAGKQDDRFG